MKRSGRTASSAGDRTDREQGGQDHEHGQDRVREEAALVEPLALLVDRRPHPDAPDQGERAEVAVTTWARRLVAQAVGDRPVVQGGGEQGAHQQLGGPGVGAVVDAVVGVAEYQGEGDGDRRQPGDDQREHLPRAPGDAQDPERQQGVEQVELLLDGEAPEVLDAVTGAENSSA